MKTRGPTSAPAIAAASATAAPPAATASTRRWLARGPSAAGSPRCTSAITSRASAMSCSRFSGSRSRQRRSRRRNSSGVPAGSCAQSISPRSTAAMVSESVSPSNGRRPVEHLVDHDAERPDVRPLVHRLAARLLRGHVRGGAENHARLRRGARERRRVEAGELALEAPSPARGSRAFARPKSSTFTAPVAVSLMLAGFRSR